MLTYELTNTPTGKARITISDRNGKNPVYLEEGKDFTIEGATITLSKRPIDFLQPSA